jgi:hypothetical protein
MSFDNHPLVQIKSMRVEATDARNKPELSAVVFFGVFD